jgi:hypothetical protein
MAEERLLPGQGIPLPADSPYRGAWVLEDRVFIYWPDGTQLVGGDAPRFTVMWDSPSGKQSVGFDAEQVAGAFDISIDELFSANNDGRFTFAGTNDADPIHGGTNATRFVFRLNGEARAIVAEWGGHFT